MKKITLSALAVVALTSFGVAGGDIEPVAEPIVVEESISSFYLGLAVADLSAREASASLNFFSEETGQDRMWNVTFLAGYDFNQYIGVEGRYTTSFTDEDVVDMDGWSLFVKPQYPVTDEFTIYALLGFGGVTLDGANGRAIDIDDTGFQWGLGASYAVTENIGIFVDYTNLANDMEGMYRTVVEADTDALTVGLTYRF